MVEEFRCADVSSSYREPMFGTASRVRDWLLIEQPGPWGYDAVAESRLDPRVTTELKRITGAHRIRLILTQRPGADDHLDRPSRCFAVHSGMDDRWIQELGVDHPSEVLDVDLGVMREGHRPAAGSPRGESLYLVCTNGAHDPCCERYGRPVAATLSAARPEQTWESSHVGGDRFAANLVCLPHGLYFGRVGPEDAVEVASLYEQGLIHLDHFRGRSCYEPVVQAADTFIRMAKGLPAIDDLVPESRRDHEGGQSTVAFRDAAGSRHAIRVAVRRAAKRPITCDAPGPGAPREYRVVSGPW